jgi:hypothetical protein
MIEWTHNGPFYEGGVKMRTLEITAITALLCIGLLATTVFPVVAQEPPGPDNKSGETVFPVVAQEAPRPDNPGEHVKGYDDWHFIFNLGEWAPAFQGSVTANGKTAPVKVTLIDEVKMLDDIKFAIGGRFEVSKGPWGLLVDGFYVSESQSVSAQKHLKIPILDPPEFTIQGSGIVNGAYSVGEAALSYDVYASPCLVANMPELTVAVLGGARDTYFRTTVNLEATALGVTRFFESDKTAGWVDPFVGWRVLWRPAEKWLASISTEYGGFTVGSEFMFNISLEAAYKINKCLFVNFGLSALYTDYETGSGNDKFAYNMWNYGPFIGVGLEF